MAFQQIDLPLHLVERDWNVEVRLPEVSIPFGNLQDEIAPERNQRLKSEENNLLSNANLLREIITHRRNYSFCETSKAGVRVTRGIFARNDRNIQAHKRPILSAFVKSI